MIVCFGGSNGLIKVLKALKFLKIKRVTAIVGVHDSGGNTGILRKIYKIPAVGDFREIVAELANCPVLNERINDMKIGNLILAILTKQFGITKAVKIISKILKIDFEILPVSEENTNLFAKTTKGIIKGEDKIEKCRKKILKIWLKPKAKANREVVERIKKANFLIFSPGSLYGSILSLLLYDGILDAIKESKAKKIIISNLKNDGETIWIKNLSQYLKEFEKFGINYDFVIANKNLARKNYIKPDIFASNVILADLNCKYGHDVKKLANILKKVIK